MARETEEQAALRWKMLRLVQEAYPTFLDFLTDAMDTLGFSVTAVQEDIAEFIADGPDSLMVEAQRGEAKSTIACIHGVYSLIRDPAHRVLVFSGGAEKAKENSFLMQRLIGGMPALKCMVPDPQEGDRTGIEAFDVHYTLKGIGASPSVRCLGITANMQGFRGDTAYLDDCETARNSETQTQRDKLRERLRDIPSIVVGRPDEGIRPRIVYLGTPQSRESVYNDLPAKGVALRVWPGRYPTPKQMAAYGPLLAPLLQQRLRENPGLASGGGADGSQGQPTDPGLKGESVLQRVELQQGTPYFQLQHMLNTALVDEARFPLRTEHAILAAGVQPTVVPKFIRRSVAPQDLTSHSVGSASWKFQSPALPLAPETESVSRIVAYVDPAAGGANGDETAYAVGLICNGTIWVLEIGGLPGGYDLPQLEGLARRLAGLGITQCVVEKNMGHGAFKAVFQPVLARIASELGTPAPGVTDDLVTGRKERRIIATLAPILGRGSLVVTQAALDRDREDCDRYGPVLRTERSVWHQLALMQDTRGAVKHDDRVDALAGLASTFATELAALGAREEQAQTLAQFKEGIRLAMGHAPAQDPRARRARPLTRRTR